MSDLRVHVDREGLHGVLLARGTGVREGLLVARCAGVREGLLVDSGTGVSSKDW